MPALQEKVLPSSMRQSYALCPNCGESGLGIFYTMHNVPVHSCLMLASRQEAMDFPTGDIALGFCAVCGFITNIAYDDSTQDYSPGYEDQQCYSPRFSAFARELAQRLVAKYALHEKTIVEIGCGKGDFLLLMCELGHNRGVGIDPAIDVHRIKTDTADHVRFIRDFYSEKYAGVTGDMIMCRHTLEHIAQTRKFLQTVRRAVGDRADIIMFFEVPDTTRVLDEAAFWDVYYEHCSYFTSGSLARLFRSCGFEVLALTREFDQQYLLIEARPTTARPKQPHQSEESISHSAERVKFFAGGAARSIVAWQTRLRREHAAGKRVAIWGSGSKCVSFLTALQLQNEIRAIVDINPHRHGKFLPRVAREVLPPQSLRDFRPDLVLVMNSVYLREICEMLAGMRLTAEALPV